MRSNEDGVIKSTGYGALTSLALDPIEKKPLCRFFPGSEILSAGSFGCNMRCPFCQNYEISQEGEQYVRLRLMPEELVNIAERYHKVGRNIGIAFTYNEPLLNVEYIRDCAELLRLRGMKTVVVTNGLINPKPWEKLLPYLDAANIDLKGFTDEYYRWLGGDLETVKTAIAMAVKAGCHVELTTLVVPGKNDGEDDMEREAAWIASLSPEIPLHISRYFPRWKCEIAATPVETIERLRKIAERHLHYVYKGNC